jgi:hypothetical protein
MIRPHIATLLAGSCGVALVLSSGVRLHWRLTISFGLLGAIVLTVPYLKEFLQLEDLSSTGVMDYMGKRQGQTLDGGSGVEISSYPFPLKFLTFLYRPLFFDANGILALVVSVENLACLVISLLYLPRAVGVLISGENTFFLRFNLVYWLLGTSILASSTANLGLAIRQKLMVLPAFIMLAMAGYAKERFRAQRAELAPAE